MHTLFSVFLITLCALVVLVASISPCGVAVTLDDLGNGSTAVLSIDVASGDEGQFTVPLPIEGDPSAATFFITATGEYFFFGPTLAYSVNVATGTLSNYTSWQTPSYNLGNSGYYMYMNFAGYDSSKGTLYSYNVQSATQASTYVLFASNIQSQTWTALSSFNVSDGFDVTAELSRDFNSVTFVLIPSDNRQANVLLNVYDLVGKSWGSTVQVTTKYEPATGTPVSQADGDVLLWLYTGSVPAAASYNVSTGAQESVFSLPNFLPSYLAADPASLSGGKVVVPGCPPALSSNATFYVTLLDVDAGAVAATFALQVGEDSIWNLYCDYWWSASGC